MLQLFIPWYVIKLFFLKFVYILQRILWFYNAMNPNVNCLDVDVELIYIA